MAEIIRKDNGAVYAVFAAGEFGGRYGLEYDPATGLIHPCSGSGRVYRHPLRDRTHQGAGECRYEPAWLDRFRVMLAAAGFAGPFAAAWEVS